MVSEISFTALFFIIQWTGILDKFVSLQSLILKDNTMNEYVDFYMQRCLQVATSIDDKSKHAYVRQEASPSATHCSRSI